ncbi:MAG: hypothetical protein GTO20_07355 [Candidatus Aminicenantes bacterium]|nr:hypothetical protein [Candidatus Aminicenantes bacterium]
MEIVKFLLEKGADINAKDIDGKTPLDIAKKKGLKEIISLLEEKAKEKATK